MNLQIQLIQSLKYEKNYTLYELNFIQKTANARLEKRLVRMTGFAKWRCLLRL